MRVLIVSSFLPFPLTSGGHVRLYNILKQLHGLGHEITLVCEKRSYQTSQDIGEVKKWCQNVITFDRKKQWSTSTIVKTAVSSYPFLLVGHTLPDMKKRLVTLLSEKKFDVIHIETFYVYQNLPKTYLPKVLVEHNIEYQVYERFVKKAPLFARPFLMVDIEKIKYWEKLWWKEATKLVAVSEFEKSHMKHDAVVVPNGVDTTSFPFKRTLSKKKTKTILFIGDFAWIQNRKAAEWILKEIWPQISVKRQALSVKDDLKLWIVGKHIPESIKIYAAKDIIIDENAPDKTADIYKKSDILLAPIEVGGGTSYKILEAMASGVPVVTTPLGVQGLAVGKGDIMVGKTTDELAKGVITLLTDAALYEKTRLSSRNVIETTYTWEKITRELERVYRDATKEV